ncbi:MAG: Flp pilus assembly complex ATPase component TadA [Burkholderiales bacterium]|nr:Flp pilus assembly complex ATPase component TadA [Burkholderiales bacterium]
MFSIEVTSPKGQKEKVDCAIDSCSIGKGDENLVVVRGWSVGKKHATIRQRPDGFYLEDHGAIGGTEVNGKNIDGTYGPLKPEDTILIGGYSIAVLNGAAGAAAPAQAAPAVAAPAAAARAPAAAPAPAEAKAPVAEEAAPAPTAKAIQEINAARNMVHMKLIQAMDLRRLDVSRMAEQELRETTKAMIDEIIANDKAFPAHLDKARIGKAVLDEVVGLGPLEDLLADPAVTEIMVNRFDQIYIERAGKLTLSEITFSGEKAVVGAIERIVAPLGRRIDESSPMVDARLKDGSRVNAVIPPLALKGANITIRKFSKEKLKDKDLIKFGSITADMMKFMEQAVLHACNIVISGGTGSGKTTLLNVLSNYIPEDERIITVEDAAELQLSQPHVISLESRPPNSEGKGAVHIRDLVKNCLRMRPDRIVVGECRGGEALDMLQAMNTGHDGSLTTAHANTPRDCLARLEVMTLMSGLDLPIRAIREQIASAVHVIIQQSRFPDGSRKVTHISEITGMEGEVIQMQDIFLFKQDGYDEKGKIKGRFIATGNIPELYQELQQRGISVDLSIFKPEGRN